MLSNSVSDLSARTSTFFEIRPDITGSTWAVFDATTGKIAKLNDTLQSGYAIEDAAEVAEFLSRLMRFRRKQQPCPVHCSQAPSSPTPEPCGA
jgi:hypothetical protein